MTASKPLLQGLRVFVYKYIFFYLVLYKALKPFVYVCGLHLFILLPSLEDVFYMA